MTNLKVFLTNLLKKNNMTQYELADNIGLARSYISMLICERKPFTAEVVSDFIDKLKMNEYEIETFIQLCKQEPLKNTEKTLLINKLKNKFLLILNKCYGDKEKMINEINSLHNV